MSAQTEGFHDILLQQEPRAGQRARRQRHRGATVHARRGVSTGGEGSISASRSNGQGTGLRTSHYGGHTDQRIAIAEARCGATEAPRYLAAMLILDGLV